MSTPPFTPLEGPAEREVSRNLETPAERRTAFALHPANLILVALFVVFFLALCYVPLANPKVGGLLTYGDWILEHGSLPTADPVMPLAEGMRVLDATWLSEVTLAAVERSTGFEGLSLGFALLGLVTALILLRTFSLQTGPSQSGRRLLGIGGLLLVLALSWGSWMTLGAESFGRLCFAVLLWLIVSSGAHPDAERPPALRRLWIGLPLLFILWVNLHPSFAYGLAVLLCLWLGRLVEVAWRSRSLRTVLTDRPMRRWLVLFEVSVAACLVNPYGLDLLLDTPWWTSNPNARSLPDWYPLVIQGAVGWGFALSALILVLVLRHSRRRVPAAHALMLGVFIAASVVRASMIAWYAMVLPLVLLPLLAEIWERRLPAAQVEERRRARLERWGRLAGPSWHYALVAIVLLWAGFALSPASTSVLGREGRTEEQVLGPDIPLGVIEHLRNNPPESQVFNPWWWGDWLARQGPPGIAPFVTSRVEVTPIRVWRDYERIAGAGPDWRRVLGRYRVHTVILDKIQLPLQIQSLRNDGSWYPVYEDEQAVVFQWAGPADPGAQSDESEDSNGEDDL